MKIAISMNHNETRRAYRTFKKLAAVIGNPCTDADDARVEKYLNEDHSRDEIRIEKHPGFNIEIQDTTVVFDITPKFGGIVADMADDIIDQIGGWIGFIRASLTALKGIVAAGSARYHKAFDRPKTYAIAAIYNHDLGLCHTFLIENDGYDNYHIKTIYHISGIDDNITPDVVEAMMWSQTEKNPLSFDLTEETYEREFERFSASVRADWNGDNNKVEETKG